MSSMTPAGTTTTAAVSNDPRRTRPARADKADAINFEMVLVSSLLAAVTRPTGGLLEFLSERDGRISGRPASTREASGPKEGRESGVDRVTVSGTGGSSPATGETPKPVGSPAPAMTAAQGDAAESAPAPLAYRPPAREGPPPPDSRLAAMTAIIRTMTPATEPAPEGSPTTIGEATSRVQPGRGAMPAGGKTDADALAESWLSRFQKVNARPATSQSTFVMPLDTGGGTEGQVRLSLRGRSLTATILTHDPETLRQMEESLGDLRQALLRRGFNEAHVRVTGPRPADPEAGHEAGRDRRRSSHTDQEEQAP